MGVANAAVVYVCRRYRRCSREQARRAQLDAAASSVAEAAYGVAWALLAALTLAGDGQNLPVVLFAIALVGIAANAISTRTLPQATLWSTAPAAITVSVNLIVTGGLINYALAAVVVGGRDLLRLSSPASFTAPSSRR